MLLEPDCQIQLMIAQMPALVIFFFIESFVYDLS